jgi:predicted nucleic acid-binding protein
MIVVDTSVWIDVPGGRRTRQAKRCVELIEGGEPVALTDVIFTEVLQGLRSEDEAQLVERHLRAFPIFASKAPTTSRSPQASTALREGRASRSARHSTA